MEENKIHFANIEGDSFGWGRLDNEEFKQPDMMYVWDEAQQKTRAFKVTEVEQWLEKK